VTAKKLHGDDKEAIAALKKDVTNIYNGMREEYDSQVKAIEAPPEKKNPVRAFWNKVIYGGVLASLTCCFGSGCYVACSEEEEPQKLMGETSAWNAENIPMPHLEDESQYVANPDKVLSKETVDSMIGARIDHDLSNQLKERICEFPGVYSAHDLTLHNYGPEEMQGSVHIVVDDNLSAKEIHRLTRDITTKIFDEFHISRSIEYYNIKTFPNQPSLKPRLFKWI
jgi:hypothetical protein